VRRGDDIIQRIVATNVRLARDKVSLSQEALADAAGIDRTYASGIERAVANPTIKVLANIAAALGVEVADLVSRSAAEAAMKAKGKGRKRH